MCSWTEAGNGAAVRRLRILTWHVHGGYLFYLARTGHELVVPVKEGRPFRYVGLPAGGYPWPSNVVEFPAERVRSLEFDCILFQTPANLEHDQFEILSPAQRALPRIYLEHDPPRSHPTDTRHPADDPDILLVHVTPFNALMWDAGKSPTRVIEHGVEVPPEVRYSGELERGITVVNNLAIRGRRLGADVFEEVRSELPIDLEGMGSEAMGGLGEVSHDALPAFVAHYRFLFNPIRYTSLGLAICEAMAIGMPIVGLATTEMATAVENGVAGYVDTRLDRLVERMRELLDDPAEARRLGEGARRLARERFGIDRFVRDWNNAFGDVVGLEAREAALAAAAL